MTPNVETLSNMLRGMARRCRDYDKISTIIAKAADSQVNRLSSEIDSLYEALADAHEEIADLGDQLNHVSDERDEPLWELDADA